jgi:hypothetical protein
MMNEIEMMMKNTPVALAYLVSNSSFFSLHPGQYLLFS